MYIGQGALAAWVGEQLAEEGYRTTKICLSLLHSLPINLSSANGKLIEKELYLLLDQSRSRKIGLYAGGSFQLDFGILGSITSTVATYSIVIIQFLLK
ncbi:uncharacterized protein LOC109535824 isoform X2 [Dendroctonus ponderosae]|uniref:uncharacterized protein LOC109535824 isoform X2 n=1 Tax=Dendroctonus ponderosae TaxID=77166 RepID=UPI002034DC76|nr:uncharacterized protein LOC109535824 isoform X2 [Dendroctonus ponderosae]